MIPEIVGATALHALFVSPFVRSRPMDAPSGVAYAEMAMGAPVGWERRDLVSALPLFLAGGDQRGGLSSLSIQPDAFCMGCI